jgi:hypothetical protein
MAIKGLKNLCTPAYVYFAISVIFLIVVYTQNYYNQNVYCLGSYSCDVTNVWLIFAMKIIYILFWTWILNLICLAGIPALSWFFVLFPFVLMVAIIATMMAFS